MSTNPRRRAYSLFSGRNVSLRDKHDLDQRFAAAWQPTRHSRYERVKTLPLRRSCNNTQKIWGCERRSYRYHNRSHSC